MLTKARQYTQLLRSEATRLGFEAVGIAPATRLDTEAQRLEQWLRQGYHGQMSYMERYFEQRLDPRLLVEGARSVVTLTFNYHNPKQPLHPDAPKIAQYAYGNDYHDLLRQRLHILLEHLRTHIGSIHGRAFVDSAPIMERQWAERGGLGWLGKNTLLINPRRGSYFFIAVLVLDIDLVPDTPLHDYCGRCRRCIEACPTGAITPSGYVLDASRCISYLTIELRTDTLPSYYRPLMQGWAFGCDICQQVCPWNRFAQPHTEEALQPSADLLSWSRQQWLDLSPELFHQVFRKSAVRRAKYAGLRRNIAFVTAADTSEPVAQTPRS